MLVVGVMVALSADSWWEDRKAGSEIATLLDVLEAELEENREELTSLLRRRATLVEQSGALVHAVVNGPPFPSSDSLRLLVYAPLEGRPPRLSLGAYEVLLGRGSTEFVAPEFMARLASHVSAVRDGYAWDDDVRNDMVRTITALIGQHGGFLATTEEQFRRARQLPHPTNELDIPGLLGDSAFQNAAAISTVLHYNWQSWLEARLRETESLLADMR